MTRPNVPPAPALTSPAAASPAPASPDRPLVEADGWGFARAWTRARVALGRVGSAPPLAEVLAFQLAHARAKDAVVRPCAFAAVRADLDALGVATAFCRSEATDRATYVRRPDLGRRLSAASARELGSIAGAYDLVLVVADGLSSLAVERNAAPLLGAFLPLARRERLELSPVVIAENARVALGDAIGEALGGRAAAVLIGERPGLSSPDSLGVYFTWGPAPGRTDAERNCISNVREGGLEASAAAERLLGLVLRAKVLGRSGVALAADPRIESA